MTLSSGPGIPAWAGNPNPRRKRLAEGNPSPVIANTQSKGLRAEAIQVYWFVARGEIEILA